MRLGELLVEARVISEEDLGRALATPRQPGQKLGDVLISMGLVTEAQLTQILGQQHAVPWVSLYHIDFSRQLLNLISRDLADRYCLVPIYVRRVKRQDTLYVAMADPSNEAALEEIAKTVGLPVKPMIAAPSDIRNAIRVYYGSVTAEPSAASMLALAPLPATKAKSLPPQKPQSIPPPKPKTIPPPPPPEHLEEVEAEAEEEAPPTLAESERLEPTAETPVARIDEPPSSMPLSSTAELPTGSLDILRSQSGDSPDAEPVIEAREIDITPKFGGPMLAITMLDGTTIRLPQRRKRREPTPDEDAPPMSEMSGGLTARDLVAALRAVSQGNEAAGNVLADDARWEKLFAALLSLLLRNGLLADWEFIEELRKM
ncbi:MAG: hypothetical protein ABI551_15790 [Polyangiaceae bacterium]